MLKLKICICTRRREEGLHRLLSSLENMYIPDYINVGIIIVENDLYRNSEYLVIEFNNISKFKIEYYLEPKRGLAFARNRSVYEASGCDFCCFVDDDQIVDTNWLFELLKCQREFNSDGVWGPNPPIFDRKVSKAMRKFHSPRMFEYGAIVNEAATNCLLLKKSILDLVDGPFDERFNFTGGEDSYLTKSLIKLGKEIRFNPNAIAYEIIPEARTKLRFIIHRSFRIANSILFVHKSLDEGSYTPIVVIWRLFRRLVYGLIIVVPLLFFGGENKYSGLIKISDSIGGFMFLFGLTEKFYK